MNKGSKRAIAVLCGAIVLGAVGMTQSWFISLNRTPLGEITSAVVYYLPESDGDQSLDDMLRYGNLISGTGVDEQGIPHVLPGETLLSTVTSAGAGGSFTRTVDTSRVRAYQTGETAGTVISSETRSYQVTEGESTQTLRVTRSRRDLFKSEEEIKENDKVVAGLPDLSGWELVGVTTDQQVKEGVTETVTVTAVTSDYVNSADRNLKKKVVVTTTETVTHEAEKYTGGSWSQFETGTFLNRMTETVLALLYDGGNPVNVRTHLALTGTAKELEAGANGVLPLSVGNCSTVDTNLRLGAACTVTPVDAAGGQLAPVALTLGAKDGAYYLGMTDTEHGNSFVELLKFQLDGSWVQAKVGTEGANVWDMTLNNKATTRIPARADKLADPELYPAITDVAIATKSAFGLQDAAFEEAFNRLYGSGSPLIELSFHFYAKQADYMDWAEFYATGISINVAGAVSAVTEGGAAP